MKQLINEDILLEKKLTTDFTFGFELEAIWDDSDAMGVIQEFFDDVFPGGDLHDDGSLREDGDYQTKFEWASPVLPVNVASFNKVIKMFRNAFDEHLFHINSSCGFHNHISYKGITTEDVIWLMSNIAINRDGIRDLISEFHGIKFANEEWADDNYLDVIAEAVRENDYKTIVSRCDTAKYSLINVHSNNTLEWRGPRGFLENEDMSVIIDFYKTLWKFVKWMADTLDAKEIEGISKENFMEGIKSTGKKIKLVDFPEFSTTEAGLIPSDKLDSFISKIIANPDLLSKMVNNKHTSVRVADQVIQKLFNKSRLGTIIDSISKSEHDYGTKVVINLAYKYIPYRIMKEFEEAVSPITLENTLSKTFERLYKTKRYSTNSVSFDNKDEVMLEILNYSGIENVPESVIDEIVKYSHNFKLLKKLMPLMNDADKDATFMNINGYIKNQSLPEEEMMEVYQYFIDIFKENTDMKKIIAKSIVELAPTYPSLLTLLKKLPTETIAKLYIKSLEKNNDSKLEQVLLSKGFISESELVKLKKKVKSDELNNDIDNTDDSVNIGESK